MTMMRSHQPADGPHSSRRTFLKQSTVAVAGTTLISAIARNAHAAGSDVIKVALIGCGDRGSGAAAQVLSTHAPVKLWAMADLFSDRLEGSLELLTRGQKAAYDRDSHGSFSDRIDVPPQRRFVGFDAYKAAIESGADLVLLTTPPHFRPMQFAYAVERGKHVFMEKPLAVDASGVRSVLASNTEARKKNLKVGVGLMMRYTPRCRETVKRLQDGAIGPIHLVRCYWNTGFLRDTAPRSADQTEMVYQLRNPYHFLWLNGDYFVDALLHFIDIGLWVKGGHPISAQGQGGRQFYTEMQSGDCFDHHTVEFTFQDGMKMFAQTRQIPRCWNNASAQVHGAKGVADIGRGRIEADDVWQFIGKPVNAYQAELDALVEAIHNDKPHNEVEHAATSTMTAIMGRMASYSGQMLSWDDALNSKLRLGPEKYAFDAPAPVSADVSGRYPVAMPGITKVL
ncbi:MAG: Gfo/Idh/MocA family oxidoreductase [Verrucomicrobiia bacterium]